MTTSPILVWTDAGAQYGHMSQTLPGNCRFLNEL